MPSLNTALLSGIMIAIVVALGWAAQQFFGGIITAMAERLAGRLIRRRSAISRREIRSYAHRIAEDDCGHPLGFLKVSVDINKVYVPLQYEVQGVRRDLYKEVRARSRTVIVGGAGAGKSVFLRNGIVEWARDPSKFDRIPVLVELHLYNDERKDLRALVVDKLNRRGIPNGRAPGILDDALESGALSLLLDGLDEVVTTRRSHLVAEIISLTESHPDIQIVVSCRDAVYDDALGQLFEPVVKIAGFDEASMRRFLRLWFTERPLAGDDDDCIGHTVRMQVEQLVSDLRKNPPIMRLAENPLMLTMIASLDADDPGLGPSIGRSRADFYKMVLTHMLRRDNQVGRFGSLTRYRAVQKQDALCAIALAAQGDEATDSGFDRGIAEDTALRHCAKTLERFRMDPTAHTATMLKEIIVRSELLSRVDERTVFFPHLTIQEYLAAVHLSDDPGRLMALYRRNPGRWCETVKLWCGADRDVTRVVSELFTGGGEADRLLAFECLADARHVDDSVAVAIIGHFQALLLDPTTSTDAIVAAFGALAAESSERGDAVFTFLWAAVRQAPNDEEVATVRALAASRSVRAAEVIAELPGWPARVALRSMGEPAIPFLRNRAATGDLESIDDLAAIATPAAALALATFLRDASPSAVRSAWRLAVLMSAPDVEEHLNSAEVDLTDVPALDWVPVPFQPARMKRPVDTVIARIAYLIQMSDFDDIPDDIDEIDVRIALPVLAVDLDNRPAMYQAIDSVGGEVAALERELDFHRPLRHNIEASQRIRNLLSHAIETHRVDSVLPLCVRFMAPFPTQRQRLWWMLKPTLQVAVVREMIHVHADPTPGMTVDNWRRLAEPLPSRILIRARVAANSAVFLLLLPLGMTQCLGAATGWWSQPWGPFWVSAMTAAALPVLIGSIAFAEKMDLETLEITLALGIIINLAALLIFGVIALFLWFDPLVMSVGVVAVAVILPAINVTATRVSRLIENPFRALIEVDQASFAVRTSVIAAAHVAESGTARLPAQTRGAASTGSVRSPSL